MKVVFAIAVLILLAWIGWNTRSEDAGPGPPTPVTFSPPRIENISGARLPRGASRRVCELRQDSSS
jgi:hypothetical protein